MKIISLFDGMSCGMIAAQLTGAKVEQYDAWEIDKYAVQTSAHNFPEIRHHGDVFDGEFTAYRGYDLLMGGSPCTYWSIAQTTTKKQTTASGMGWELFSQYFRALHEAQPRVFIYENNQSMSDDIKACISEAFGFEPIAIDSATVSAQSRKRLYWVGVRQPDLTYRKAPIAQPACRGIMVRDILDTAAGSPARGSVWGRTKAPRHSLAPKRVGTKPRQRDGVLTDGQAFCIYSVDGKGTTLKANAGGAAGKTGLYAVPGEPAEGQTAYDVKGCRTEIDGRQYPIKLRDGRYVIRPLTVAESKRLQTVPDWYDFSVVSEEQARKMLGNGWTCEVIAHLIRGARQACIFGSKEERQA